MSRFALNGLCVAMLCACGDAPRSSESPPDGAIPSDADVHDTTSPEASPDTTLPAVPPDPGGVSVLAGDALRGYFDGPAAMARFQGVTALLAVLVAVMTAFILALSVRLREAELDTLKRIGCSRRTLAGSIALEALLLVGLAAAVAAITVGAVALLVPDPTRWI